jgi:hypothetical protein
MSPRAHGAVARRTLVLLRLLRHRSARALLPAALLLAMGAEPVLPGAPLSAEQTSPGPTLPSAAETLAELREICARLTEGDNPFFGTRVVATLERRLASTGLDPVQEARLRGNLGVELLRLGRPQEAIATLDRARELVAGDPRTRELDRQLARDLALAHLRAAETTQCAGHRSPDRCLLPVTPGGVHAQPRHARAAGDLYAELLGADPEDIQTRWLLNVARMLSGDYPEAVPPGLRLPAGALEPEAPFPRWRDIAPALGVDVFDLAGGAVMDDFDGDGWLDLVTSTNDPCGPLRAFRNDGRGGFEEVTAAWGLDAQLGGLNLIHGDFDGDGQLDLLVLRGGWWGEHGEIRNSLLRNALLEPAGRFVDVTEAAGLAWPAYPTQTAAFADFDGDGHLDLYVGNEASHDAPYPSQLFRNNGDGTFTDVTAAAGVANVRYAKGVAWGDYDGDGYPDLFVSNIGPNRLYRNLGDGTFRDLAPVLGVTGGDSRTFATWFFDFDNDGDLDLFVADYGATIEEVSASYLGLPTSGGHPLLYRNDAGRFTEVSREVGLTRPVLPMGANHGDLDNDGWPDLYLGTGVPDYEAVMPNVMLRNVEGRRFVDVTFAGGFGHLQKGHGVAFGDFDHDGDQDLLHQLGGQYPGDGFHNALFENPGNDHGWVTLQLVGRQANRYAVGARVEVRVPAAAGSRSIHSLVGSGGSFGGSTLRAEIGLGTARAIESVTIVWPGSGRVQRFLGLPPQRIYRFDEGAPRGLAPAPPSSRGFPP